MKLKPVAKLLAFSGAAVCFGAMPVLADGEHCRHVGGGVLTNFLQAADCGSSPLGLCTDGTTTGDISGAIGVSVLIISGNVYHNHHHWVTTAGDTIFAKDADLTAFSTSDPNRILADYLNGVEITGGTGAFEGATGTVFFFGAVDLKLGELTLRYEGTVCFATVPRP